MTHVLAMSALELRHPVIFRVRVKAGDFLVHSRMDNTLYFLSRSKGDLIHSMALVRWVCDALGLKSVDDAVTDWLPERIIELA
jgi:hypothetical protein